MLTRYLGVGGVATLVHYLVLMTMVERHWAPPPAAAGLGALCGALVAYAGNRHFTFASDRLHHIAVPRFLLVALLGAALSSALVFLGGAWLGLHYLLSQAVATLAAVLLTFHLNSRWTFA